eukprot:359790-Pleurochrysis_carterae.AAC.6
MAISLKRPCVCSVRLPARKVKRYETLKEGLMRYPCSYDCAQGSEQRASMRLRACAFMLRARSRACQHSLTSVHILKSACECARESVCARACECERAHKRAR